MASFEIYSLRLPPKTMPSMRFGDAQHSRKTRSGSGTPNPGPQRSQNRSALFAPAVYGCSSNLQQHLRLASWNQASPGPMGMVETPVPAVIYFLARDASIHHRLVFDGNRRYLSYNR